MPAQSPTLSPTLSAMVAALRGSSSGMPASILPTRSAPTSAALVKMPPPTRMNSAMSEAPNAKPTSTAVAEFWKIKKIPAAPVRPSPTQRRPVTAPVRKATRRAPGIPLPLTAAAAVQYLDAIDETQAAALYREIPGGKFAKVSFIGDLDHDGLVQFRDGAFDFVVMNHVLEHVANPVKAVREVFRICREGGIVAMAVPDKD